MKTITATPVIFRCFGREINETSYRLPGFLFGYIATGHSIIRVDSQIREISAGNSFLIARREEATITLLPEVPASYCCRPDRRRQPIPQLSHVRQLRPPLHPGTGR